MSELSIRDHGGRPLLFDEICLQESKHSFYVMRYTIVANPIMYREA